MSKDRFHMGAPLKDDDGTWRQVGRMSGMGQHDFPFSPPCCSCGQPSGHLDSSGYRGAFVWRGKAYCKECCPWRPIKGRDAQS